MPIIMVLAIWLTMVVAGDTVVGRMMRSILVDRPAAGLNKLRRGHLVLAMLAGLIGGAAMWWGGADAARMLAMAAPDLVAWTATFEIATYLDVAVALAVAASTIRIRFIAIGVARALRHRRRRPAAGRARRARLRRSADNDDDKEDDDDGRGLAIAA